MAHTLPPHSAINLSSRRRPLPSCCVLHAAQLRARRVLPICPTLSALPPSQLRHRSSRSWVIWASVIFQLPVLALPPVSIKILGRRRSHMASRSQVLSGCSFGRASPHQRKSRDSIFHPCSPTCHVLCLTGTAAAQPVLEIWSFWLDISVRVSVDFKTCVIPDQGTKEKMERMNQNPEREWSSWVS